MKYKCGDIVLIKMTVSEVTDNGSLLLLENPNSGIVVSPKHVIALVSRKPKSAVGQRIDPLTCGVVGDGWTPASEPPKSNSDVAVLLKNGKKRRAWHGNGRNFVGVRGWQIYPKNSNDCYALSGRWANNRDDHRVKAWKPL